MSFCMDARRWMHTVASSLHDLYNNTNLCTFKNLKVPFAFFYFIVNMLFRIECSANEYAI